jgi:hypothetical protein
LQASIFSYTGYHAEASSIYLALEKQLQGQHKFFVWLLVDRLNTRNLLKRNHFALPSYNCVLCQGNVEETVEHLFFECPFSEWCWRLMNVQWPQNVVYNPSYSACFFSRNSIFLSQKISQQYFSAGL